MCIMVVIVAVVSNSEVQTLCADVLAESLYKPGFVRRNRKGHSFLRKVLAQTAASVFLVFAAHQMIVCY